MSKQLALFPELEAPVKPQTPRRHAEMLRLYGCREGRKCGECGLFILKVMRRGYWYKCKIAGVSNSQATDWCKKWDACGLFVE